MATKQPSKNIMRDWRNLNKKDFQTKYKLSDVELKALEKSNGQDLEKRLNKFMAH